MTLRAFTSQHKLQDTEEQYVKAVYRFRDAEQKQSLSYTAAKCEMNRLEADLFRLRYSIHSDMICSSKSKKMVARNEGCPIPNWST